MSKKSTGKRITEYDSFIFIGKVKIEECPNDAFGYPIMGSGIYVTLNARIDTHQTKKLKLVGIKSKEFDKIKNIAEKKGNPLGLIGSWNAIAKSIGFDGIYSNDYCILFVDPRIG